MGKLCIKANLEKETNRPTVSSVSASVYSWSFSQRIVHKAASSTPRHSLRPRASPVQSGPARASCKDQEASAPTVRGPEPRCLIQAPPPVFFMIARPYRLPPAACGKVKR
ncbi:hypothetical protein E2C01_039616 [Portunus trituberculatus]|uniref:Uncharacterized protein n=1 Tax=Portunus trituberculatus TaxID=210409 RepID=A0A5B7FE33_PORTR|nr:hypothetical protein [Portunus trituberculatus]